MVGLKNLYYVNFEFKFWINRFIALALIPLQHLEDAMKIIIATMPNKDQVTIKFVRYFAKQWLNGNQSPEIWNHHETIGRRTNNGLEGYHHKIATVTPNPHPQLQTQIDLFKRENALATDKFAKSKVQVLQTPKSRLEDLKDQNIFLIHEEFKGKLDSQFSSSKTII